MYMGINSTFLAYKVSYVKELQYPDSYSNFENFECANRMLTHIWRPNDSKTPILCSHILCFPGFYTCLYCSGQIPMRVMLYFASVYIPDFTLYQNLPFIFLLLPTGGLGSVVGILTVYGLDGPGIESRWGAKFSAPVQTSSGAHPASCTLGIGSFPGVEAAGAWG